jgi:hypothetical protein
MGRKLPVGETRTARHAAMHRGTIQRRDRPFMFATSAVAMRIKLTHQRPFFYFDLEM